MKLTNATEKGMAIVAMLITQENNRPVPSTLIMTRMQISDSYTKKILRKLSIAKIIYSIPGNNGGFRIAKDPDKITLLEIIEAIEGPIKSYPNRGTFKSAYKEYQQETTNIEKALMLSFNESDLLWKDKLKNETLQNILKNSLGHDYEKVDWLKK